MEIELPDGTILDAPDDADPSAVARAYMARHGKPTAAAERPKDYRDKYAGQSLLQGNLSYAKDYLTGLGKAAVAPVAPDGTPAMAGVGDAALHLGTSALAPLFSLPDYAITKMGVPDPRNPSGTYAGAREKYVYEPRTSLGKAGSNLVGAALKPVGDVFSLIGSGYGDIAGLAGASPETQKEIRDIAPDVVNAGLLAGSLRAPKQKQAPIPTTDELRTAKNAAYKAGSSSNVLTSPQQNAAAISKVDDALRSENLVVDPDLHPKSTALIRRLRDQQNRPLTVPEAESMRQLALEVQRDLDPVTRQPTADAYRAGVILDELDNALDTLTVNKDARALNARYRRSQMVDEMVRNAELNSGAKYTQAGMEQALRNEFKKLALNPRRMRGLTTAQRAAVEKVVKGGPIENSLRSLGKFDPTTGGMAAFIGTGTGGMVGTALGGLVGGGLGTFAVPAAGFLAKRGATALTAKNVASAREALVGRGGLLGQAAPAAGQVAAQPGLLGASASPLLGAARRSVEQIQADLVRLDKRIQALPRNEPLDSARSRELAAEYESLRAELAAAGVRPASSRSGAGSRDSGL